jgi:hypothetical protein
MLEAPGIGGNVRWLTFILGVIGLSALAQGSALRSRELRKAHHARSTRFSLVKIPPVGTPAIASGAGALGTLAIGSLAIAGLAIGALAIGALAVGRLEIRKARLGKVEIDELTVHRLRAVEQQPDQGSST